MKNLLGWLETRLAQNKLYYLKIGSTALNDKTTPPFGSLQSGVHKGGFSKGGFSNTNIITTHKLQKERY